METALISGGFALFLVTSIVAVRTELSKRPTFENAEKSYARRDMCQQRHEAEKKLCNEIHKSVEEKIKHLPEIRESLIRIEETLKKMNGNK